MASEAGKECAARRNQLPIATLADDIHAALAKAQVCIVCGETGSGKSTQVCRASLLRDGRMMTHCVMAA